MHYLESVFGPDGMFAKGVPGYEQREGQVALATAIDDAFSGSKRLLAEAPTGTGKSYAYLVPAIHHVGQGRTIVVTANIALQEQLVKKDLPRLAELVRNSETACEGMPGAFKFALAKGINNDGCRLSITEARTGLLMGERNVVPVAERANFERVCQWSDTTELGDLSELPFESRPALRSHIARSSEDCIGRDCDHLGSCWGHLARARYAEADIVVTNYHLFFVDLQLKAMGLDGVLPQARFVVFDEAHRMSEIARDFFGWRVSEWAVKMAAAKLPEPHRTDVQTMSSRFFSALREHYHGEWYKTRLVAPEEIDGRELASSLEGAAAIYDDVAKTGLELKAKLEIMKFAGRCKALASEITTATNLEGENAVYFLAEENDRVALEMRPVEVAELLAASVFESARFSAVVATSATLATDGGSFEFIRSEMGAHDAEELVAPSPFDFTRSTVLALPSTVEPSDREWLGEVCRTLVDVVARAEGRTLALFTSYKALEQAHRSLLAARLPYRVMRQGDAPRMQLIELFKEDVSSVLLGTASFWEGVDVPGESLSVLFVDKLPFDAMGDPVISVIQERDSRGWFKNHVLPRAITAFRQGFGRLIRTRTDRGVVVCCDRRLVSKPYGSRFIRSLPKVRVVRDLEIIGPFLEGDCECQDEPRPIVKATPRAKSRIRRRSQCAGA